MQNPLGTENYHHGENFSCCWRLCGDLVLAECLWLLTPNLVHLKICGEELKCMEEIKLECCCSHIGPTRGHHSGPRAPSCHTFIVWTLRNGTIVS